MRTRLLILLLALAGHATLRAQDTDEQKAHYETLLGYVEQANKAYVYTGYRDGIRMYADSVEMVLSRTGWLTPTDSLRGRALLMKLWGDWHYENSYYDDTSHVKAEAYYRDALRIYESSRAFRVGVDYKPAIYEALAQLHYKQRRYEQAYAEIERVDSAYRVAWWQMAVTDTARMAKQAELAIIAARLHKTEAVDLINEVIDQGAYRDEDRAELLRKKAKILMLLGGDGCRAEAAALYRSHFDYLKQRVLTALDTLTARERHDYWMGIRPFAADAYQTTDADPGLLYDIALFSKGLLLQFEHIVSRPDSPPGTAALQSLRLTWPQLQRLLRRGDVAVEFVQYLQGDTARMGALVLRHTGEPQWVDMLPPDDFMGHHSGGRTVGERIYSQVGRLKDGLYTDSLLQARLWNDELIRAIGPCRRLYFAPDGYLHLIAIEYMAPAALEGTELHRLTSTRRLMDRRTGPVPSDAALLIGGINYDARIVTDTIATPPHTADNDTVATAYIRSAGGRFNYLPGTRQETDSIYTIRHCPADTLLTGDRATEMAVRLLAGTRPIVALSTHGHFSAATVPMGTDLIPCRDDESLSQSVLALSGANSAQDGDKYDGLLSALELSATDMSHVELAILSACQTGLGYVTADGVYGLQRGLKNAGVGSMIVSLWNVSDDATRLLMTELHRQLMAGRSTYHALAAARAALMTYGTDGQSDDDAPTLTFDAARLVNVVSTPDRPNYNHPRFTHAFILIDAL